MADVGVPCYDCYISSDLICKSCENKTDVCLNCIYYGDGGMCSNCEEGDEGISTEYDTRTVLEWIIWNTDYWL